MLKAIIAGVLAALTFCGIAAAQTCPAYTYTLTNGTTADANQVMANFNTIATCANGSLAPLANPRFTGNVGINTSSATYKLQIANGLAAAGDGTGVYIQGYQAGLQLMNKTYAQDWYAAVNDASSNEFDIGRGYGPNQGVNIALRINTADQVGFNGSAPGGWSGNSGFSVAGSNTWASSFYNSSASGGAILSRVDSTSVVLAAFYYGGSVYAGSITTNGTGVGYNTSSDYRFKTNVEPINDGLAQLMQLQPKRFNWKALPSEPKADGFLAHEVQAVLPYAVVGKKDAVNPDGTIKPQQIDYSKLVPLLVAAVKEQQGEIEQLKSQVAALKSAH